MKYFFILCIVCLLFGIYLFSLHLIKGDLLFHTDIARDFWLIQDVVVNHKIALIGARVGGIPGTFFGPLWIYLNLPAFVMGNGNPLVIGYFWLFLMLVGLAITFYVTKKVFSSEVALFAITIFIYSILFLAPGFTSSFGPVVFSPLLLYAMYLFIEKGKIKYLGGAVFLSGFIFQFQPAFGSIALFITFILSLLFLIKRKQLRYLTIWFIACIPLSSYIVFELRHNFLELHALYNFIFHHNSQLYDQVTYSEVVGNRIEGFLDTLNLININAFPFNTLFVIINSIVLFFWIIAKKSSTKTFIFLVYFYLIGFWLITFLFKGTVWNYYYWGFNPLLSIALASLYKRIDRRLFISFFILLLALMIGAGYKNVNEWRTNFFGKDTSSWIVNKQVADYIYQDAPKDFGFYVYSTDNFGYAKRYAMNYVGRTGNYQKNGFACQKRGVTYLIINLTTPGTHTDPVYWKNVQVAITNKPVSIKTIQKVTIEKIILTQSQFKIPSDPTMICGIEWR